MAKIAEHGEAVRTLKGEKVTATPNLQINVSYSDCQADFTAELGMLKAAKEEYKTLTGEDAPAAGKQSKVDHSSSYKALNAVTARSWSLAVVEEEGGY